MEYTEENYKNARPNDVFEFVCEQCGEHFSVTKKAISKNRGRKPKYCSVECANRAKCRGTVTVVCSECGKEYEIARSEYERKMRLGSLFFCCRSCAAKYNNRVYKKKTKSEKDDVCPICGNKKTPGSKVCSDCEKKRRTSLKRERTLGYYISKSGDMKYLTHRCQSIRKDARIFMETESKQEKVCAYCHNHEFDDILEVHHIKGILSFDLDAKIKDINNDENLVWLCPNHHTMVEKGMITVV